jgi:hypothetical protein
VWSILKVAKSRLCEILESGENRNTYVKLFKIPEWLYAQEIIL